MGVTGALTARPLALAGLGAVVGALLAAQPGPWTGAGALLLLPLLRRPAAGVLFLAALAAGFVSGHEAARRAERILAQSSPWPRAPPRTGSWVLSVRHCGADPLANRAWLEGSRPDGTGVLCSWPGPRPACVAPGARVRVSGRFVRPAPVSNPGERGSREALAWRGIGWRAYLRTARNVELLEPAPAGLGGWLAALRARAAERLRDALPPDGAPLAAALLLGLRESIDDEDRLRFERTGTLHVLAISGMHLVLLAGLVHAWLRALGAGPRLAASVTLALALLYAPLVGGAPPIRRALAMLVCYGLALARGRMPDPASALGGAALWLTLTDPADLLRPGFRLSFAAVAAIAWLAPAWHRRWSERYALLARFPAVQEDQPLRLLVWGYLLRALPVSLAAWCATQPLVAREFGLVTLLAPFVNVLLAPLVGLCLPLVAGVACGLSWLGPPAALLLRAMRALLEGAAEWPGGCLVVAAVPAAAVAGWLAGAVLLRARPRTGIALCLVATALGTAPRAAAEPLVALFDVGHGQALLLRGPKGTVLVDAGSRSRPDVGRRVLLPALRALGVTRLDAVFVTHADADHYNGLGPLLVLLPARQIVVGPDPPPTLVALARRHHLTLRRARRGLRVAGVDVVMDGREEDASRNDRSLALVWEAGGLRLFLPADREEAGLRAILARGVEPCDVMVAPHHGAGCETAPEFGRALRPRLLLVSTGRDFADEATLRAYGGDVWRTDRDGCLLLRGGPGGWRLETARGHARATIRAP